MKVTLIVAGYDRARLFRYSIPSWFRFTKPDEFIFINDGGHDETEAIFNEWKQKEPNVNFIYKYCEKSKWRNPAVPHNWGVKTASSEIIAITDPECILITDGIGMLKRDMEENPRRFISGGIVYFPGSVVRFSPEELTDPIRITQRGDVVDYYTGYISKDHDIVKMESTASHFFGGCMKELWMAVGGKDERFIAWGNEDMHLYGRLSNNGTPLYRDNDIILVHQYHERTPAYAMEKTEEQRTWWEKDGEAGVIVANVGREWGVL